MPKQRAEHFEDYADITEVSEGVFIDAGNAVYIVDDEGEVVSWNADEAAEDGEAFTAALNATALACLCGAGAVRECIATNGATLENLIQQTYDELTSERPYADVVPLHDRDKATLVAALKFWRLHCPCLDIGNGDETTAGEIDQLIERIA
jgi:hypothetical protein